MSHNDFRNGDQLKRRWKLFIAFLPGSEMYTKAGKSRYYYNFEPDTDFQKQKLINNCYLKVASQVQSAILYDNHTHEEIERLK